MPSESPFKVGDEVYLKAPADAWVTSYLNTGTNYKVASCYWGNGRWMITIQDHNIQQGFRADRFVLLPDAKLNPAEFKEYKDEDKAIAIDFLYGDKD